MKVIAIIDKPRSCKECPFKDTPISFCLGEYEKEKRCPLKPLPIRKKFDNQIPYEKSGWNDRLNELLGGKE